MIATYSENRIDEFNLAWNAPDGTEHSVEFTEPSHGLFAHTLDQREISWMYKPRTFAVDWDAEGNFVGSFTPDFYLPDYDQYVELASGGQLTEKTRNVRLLRQNYPNVRIRLIAETSQIFFQPEGSY